MNTKSKSSKVVKFTQEINFLKNLDFQLVKTNCYRNDYYNINVSFTNDSFIIKSGDVKWNVTTFQKLSSIVNELIKFDTDIDKLLGRK